MAKFESSTPPRNTLLLLAKISIILQKDLFKMIHSFFHRGKFEWRQMVNSVETICLKWTKVQTESTPERIFRHNRKTPIHHRLNFDYGCCQKYFREISLSFMYASSSVPVNWKYIVRYSRGGIRFPAISHIRRDMACTEYRGKSRVLCIFKTSENFYVTKYLMFLCFCFWRFFVRQFATWSDVRILLRHFQDGKFLYEVLIVFFWSFLVRYFGTSPKIRHFVRHCRNLKKISETVESCVGLQEGHMDLIKRTSPVSFLFHLFQFAEKRNKGHGGPSWLYQSPVLLGRLC